MKYRSNVYAKALVNALLHKKTDDQQIAVNVLALLKKNGDIKKSKQIIVMAEKILLKATGNKKVVFEIARKTDIQDLIKSFTKKGDVVEEKINPKIVAGVKIIVDDN